LHFKNSQFLFADVVPALDQDASLCQILSKLV